MVKVLTEKFAVSVIVAFVALCAATVHGDVIAFPPYVQLTNVYPVFALAASVTLAPYSTLERIVAASPAPTLIVAVPGASVFPFTPPVLLIATLIVYV